MVSCGVLSRGVSGPKTAMELGQIIFSIFNSRPTSKIL
jgi:hypothetical protein